MSEAFENLSGTAASAITPLSMIFIYRFINFEWVAAEESFKPIKFDVYLPYDQLRKTYTDPSRLGNQDLRDLQRLKFGLCQVEVPKRPCSELFVKEVLNPFYIFQVFAIALWTYDNYYLYAGCIFIVSTLSLVASIVEITKNNN